MNSTTRKLSKTQHSISNSIRTARFIGASSIKRLGNAVVKVLLYIQSQVGSTRDTGSKTFGVEVGSSYSLTAIDTKVTISMVKRQVKVF